MCEIADAFVKIGYDQGIEQGIERGIEQGIERGIERGIEQGIKSMIEALQELGVSKTNTLSKVAEKFNLEDKTAVFYMDKYWI